MFKNKVYKLFSCLLHIYHIHALNLSNSSSSILVVWKTDCYWSVCVLERNQYKSNCTLHTHSLSLCVCIASHTFHHHWTWTRQCERVSEASLSCILCILYVHSFIQIVCIWAPYFWLTDWLCMRIVCLLMDDILRVCHTFGKERSVTRSSTKANAVCVCAYVIKPRASIESSPTRQ